MYETQAFEQKMYRKRHEISLEQRTGYTSAQSVSDGEKEGVVSLDIQLVWCALTPFFSSRPLQWGMPAIVCRHIHTNCMYFMYRMYSI